MPYAGCRMPYAGCRMPETGRCIVILSEAKDLCATIKKSAEVFMRIVFIFLIGAFILSCKTPHISTTKESEASLEERAQKVFSMISEPMVTCPEKVWPGFSWQENNLQVVLFSTKLQKARLWNHQAREGIEHDYANIPELALKKRWHIYTIGDLPAISFKTDDEHDDFELVDTLIHEAFHGLFQKSNAWKGDAEDADTRRGSFYPLQWEPRYQRYMLWFALNLAIKDPNSESRDKAAAWYSQWRTSFPVEADNIYDRKEGAAQYVGTMAAAIGVLGCSSSVLERQSYLLEQFRMLKIPPKRGLYRLDDESYRLGISSGILLDSIGNTTWKQEVNDGSNSLKVLFREETSSHRPKDDPKIMRAYQYSYQEKNEEIGPLLNPLLSKLTRDRVDFIGLSLNATWDGGYDRKGFYILQEKSDAINMVTTVVVDDGLYLTSEVTGSEVELGEGGVFLIGKTLCGEGYTFVVDNLPAGLAKGQTINLTENSLKIEATVEDVKQYTGGSMVCVK
jgi:hypothetical protein